MTLHQFYISCSILKALYDDVKDSVLPVLKVQNHFEEVKRLLASSMLIA